MKPDAKSDRRDAATLVEVLVVVAVAAVLVGLLLAGVQSAQLSAARADALNSTRQLLLATHSFAGAHGGATPNPNGERPNQGHSIPRALSPHLGASPNQPPTLFHTRTDPSEPWVDPTPPPPGFPPFLPQRGCSFAFNAGVYSPPVSIPHGVPDGLSRTLAITEHFGVCGPTLFSLFATKLTCTIGQGSQQTVIPCSGAPMRRATFADHPMFDDVHPVTTVRDGVPVTVGSLPLTFQVRPPLDQCDPRIPNSSLPGGILAGFLDGSARFLRPATAPEVFWGSVTPAGGESITLD